MPKRSIHANLMMREPPVYKAEPTPRRFHMSSAMVRCLRGPIGTGKSSACVEELRRRAFAQKPYNGIRSTRFAAIRETYGELARTTLKDFLEWIPPGDAPGYKVTVSYQPPMVVRIIVNLEDGTTVDSEVIFIALESSDDEKKLRSWNLTGGWINEGRYIEYSNFVALRERIGRYPAMKDGGMSWHGIIIDTNPPSNKHWIYDLFEVQKPAGYEMFTQPPAVLPLPKKDKNDVQLWVANQGQDPRWPAAENVRNHNKGFNYWLDLTVGVSEAKIRVDLMGEYGTLNEGRPVFPEYNDSVHCKDAVQMLNGIPLLIAWDFGLSPCCLFAQLTPFGRLQIVDELVSGLTEADIERLPKGKYFGQMGIRQFATTIVKPYMLNHFAGIPFMSVGDPAGSQRGQTDEQTCMQILQEVGLPTESARTQNFIARREAVVGYMQRNIEGPGFLVDSKCHILREGLIGEYKYRKMMGKADEYTEEPEKNKYSHICDALTYLAMRAEDGGASGFDHMTGQMTNMRSGRRRVVRVKCSP